MTPEGNHLDAESSQLGYGDYLRFSILMKERCGLYFAEKRRAELSRGVQRAFAVSTCCDLDEYYHLLQDPDEGAVHMERLINALTVGETHFFRDADQFDALYNYVLPQIIERRRPLRTLRIWSAGCASGEEPYSIAILLRELLPDVDDWAITILGTDVNTEALGRARQATYGNWAFREEQAKLWQQYYFRKSEKRYELKPEVRHMVTFARLNLAQGHYPAYDTNTTYLDLILCRNVLMYLDEATIRKVTRRLYKALTQEGWLIVGHAEHSLVPRSHFQVHNYPHAILYQRAEEQAPPAGDYLQPVQLPEWKQSAPSIFSPPSRPAQPVPKRSALPQKEKGTVAREEAVERARELLDYGQSAQALNILLKEVKSESPSPPVYALLGQAYANLGRWKEAERWCRQAVSQDSLALDAYYTLALVLQHQERIEEAIGAMKKVIYIDRHHVLGHFGLADLYRSNHQLPQAIKSLENARRLLNGRAEGELVSGAGGITVGSLRETIVRQQQRWSRV